MNRVQRDIRRAVREAGLPLVSVGHRGCGHYAVTVEAGGRQVTVSASCTPSCAGWIHAFRRKLRRAVG